MSLTKKPTRKEINRALGFVVDEIVRYDRLSRDHESIVKAIKDDGWLYQMPFPDGRRPTIGKAAHEALTDISRAIVASDERLKGKVKVSSYSEILSEKFGRALFEKTEIDEPVFIEECTAEAASKLLEVRDIYIPCIAPDFLNMKKFRIGPVSFYEKESFLRDRAGDIQQYKHLNFEDFESYYKVQNWIACVRVSDFQAELGTERAYLMVRLALASIKCYMDTNQSKWIGTERQSMPTLRRFSLASYPEMTTSNQIHVGWSVQYVNSGGGKDSQFLLSKNARGWFNLLGAFLDANKDKGYWNFLDTKIITAMIWLDIGNSQISDAEKVVAFSNCLEALFVSSDQGIKRQIVDRSAGFLEHSGWFPELNDRVGDFYLSRCKLVHGEASPISADIREAAHIGKYLTDVCMEGFLHFAHWMLLKHQAEGTREHELPYTGKGSFEKAMLVELPLFLKVIGRGVRRETG
mgnify:CR=1 FL=1